ncbi:hypothetical protein GCM10028796_32430 [Ramlibacter monticola]
MECHHWISVWAWAGAAPNRAAASARAENFEFMQSISFWVPSPTLYDLFVARIRQSGYPSGKRVSDSPAPRGLLHCGNIPHQPRCMVG